MKQHPNLCAHCGGKCCTSPLLSNREIRLMMAGIGEAKVVAARPVHEGNGWSRLSVCPALGPDGCALQSHHRPIVCRLYPFQFIVMPNGGYRIMLDVDKCPYWRTFGEEYQEALTEFKEFLKREKQHADSPQP
jgi:Fe-S-cluster containining protein